MLAGKRSVLREVFVLTEKIGVIGAGKIGAAIARGIIQAGLVKKDGVMASDVSAALRQSITQELGIKATADNHELCDFADIVIVAVKPQIVDPVAREIAKKLGKGKLLVSVAAGVPLGRIETHLEPGARVVRVMPNIACVVGAGAAGYAAGTHATAADLEKVGAILNSFGVGMAVEEKVFGRSHRAQRQRSGVRFSFHGSLGRRRRASRFNARRRAQIGHPDRLRRCAHGP